MIVTRKKHFMKSRRQLWAGAMFLLAMVTLGAFIFAYAKPKLARRSSGSIAIPVQDPAKSVSTKERIATELIVLGPNGFEPATLTRTPGKFLLAIDNRTGLNGLTFELDGVDGTRQRAALLEQTFNDFELNVRVVDDVGELDLGLLAQLLVTEK